MKGQQPKGAAPISRDVVDNVKKKMAPAGPPPAGMSFHAPKRYTGPPRVPSQYDEFDNHIEDERDYRGGSGSGRHGEDDDDDRYYKRGRDDETEDYDSVYSEGDDFHGGNSFDEDDRYDEGVGYVHRPDGRGIADRDDDERWPRGGMRRGSGSGRDSRDRSPRGYEDEDPDRRDRDRDRAYSHGEDGDGYGYGGEGVGGRGRASSGAHRRDSHGDDGDRDYHDSRDRHVQEKAAEPKSRADDSRERKTDAGHKALTLPAERPRQQHPQAAAHSKVAAKHQELLQMKRRDMVAALLLQAKSNVFSYQPVLRATYRELRHFVTFPCPPGVTARCYIERNRSGTKMLAPFYSVCADLEDGTGRELMVCRKIMRSRSPHYIFSLKAEDLWRKREQRSRLYLGKLRATSAMEYVLFDNGICDAPEEPESLLEERERFDELAHPSGSSPHITPRGDKKGEGKEGGAAEDASLYRKELAVIHFNTKARPAPAGKRGTEVCLPSAFSLDVSGQMNMLGKPNAGAAPGAPVSTLHAGHPHLYNLAKPFEKVRAQKKQNELHPKSCFVLHERTSRYDPLSACLVDFKGRANMASVKNCQFVVSDPAEDEAAQGQGPSAEAALKRDAEKEWVMQLGKTTDDCFNMDFRYPLSLLQAFSIAVARFDAKLTW